MRHRKKGKILDRKVGPRRALLRNLATNLVLYEKVTTTEARAKVIRPYAEKLITTGKKNTLHARRELLKKLYGANSVKKILEVLAPRYEKRSGGYLRIIRLGHRPGDGAKKVRIEFV